MDKVYRFKILCFVGKIKEYKRVLNINQRARVCSFVALNRIY